MSNISLRAERLNRGLSAEAAAAEMGVDKQVLLNAENGSTPRPATAYKIATFYGYLVTDIWPVEEPEGAAA
jgi:transcriptional regulator with XRE-family HTH domain